MNNTDQEIFNRLLAYVRAHSNSKYTFIDEKKKAVDSVFDAVYESDNGLEEYEDGYESYQCISFKAISDGMLFEINKYHIPMKAFCDGKEINYEISDHTDKKEIMANEGEEEKTDCFGSLSLSVDPLEFQRSVGEEWE